MWGLGNMTLAETSYLMFGKSICLPSQSINQASSLGTQPVTCAHRGQNELTVCQMFCGVLFRNSSLAVSVTLQSVAFLNIIHKIFSESPFAYS